MSNIDAVENLTILMACVAGFFIILNMLKKNRETARQGEMKIRDLKRELDEQFHAVRKAAEQGDATAQAKLGFAYYSGDRFPQGDKEAVK
jgi:TPR repeat protein